MLPTETATTAINAGGASANRAAGEEALNGKEDRKPSNIKALRQARELAEYRAREARRQARLAEELALDALKRVVLADPASIGMPPIHPAWVRLLSRWRTVPTWRKHEAPGAHGCR